MPQAIVRRKPKASAKSRRRLSGKPRCGCWSFLSQLSKEMQKKWALREGERWFRLSAAQCDFRYCKSCHKAKFPADVRSQNRYCRPGVAWWKLCGATKVGYVCGDLWLTAPVPERRGAEQRPARQTRRKRKQLVTESVESAERTGAECSPGLP